MFTVSGIFSQFVHNDLRARSYITRGDKKVSAASTPLKKSLLSRFNSFVKKKSLSANSTGECGVQKKLKSEEFPNVKVLQQFWNGHIKTKKLTESAKQKVNDSIIQVREPCIDSTPKTLILDGRLPFEEFNKHKNADFVRHKKRNQYFASEKEKVSAESGGRACNILQLENEMSEQSNSCVRTIHTEIKNESISSSTGSLNSLVSSTPNSTVRKISFKTHRNSTLASYVNRNGTKVAQLAQRFNQLIKNDASLINEVKKRGTVVLHRSGGHVIKIKEEKLSRKTALSRKSSHSEEISDDASSLAEKVPSINKNSSRRKKCPLGKRPSIRVLVGKDAISGNVLMKRQFYETNIINKDMKPVEKPTVPEKSQQVLARTKEMKEKKVKTETTTPTLPNEVELHQSTLEEKKDSIPREDCKSLQKIHEQKESSPWEDCKSLQKIYDKVSLKRSFLYGNKLSEFKEVEPVKAISQEDNEIKPQNADDASELTNFSIESEFCNEKLEEPPLEYTEQDLSTNHGFRDVAVPMTPNEVKPNESFLFGSQYSSGRLEDSTSDIDLQDTSSSKCYSNVLKCNTDLENGYETFSDTLLPELKKSESADDDFESESIGEENIYQSLFEVKLETGSVKSYESFENYDEIVQNILDNKISLSELSLGNDSCTLSDKAPEPPPPRKNTLPRISSPILTSTTSKLIQPVLQVPKQSFELEKAMYERISYGKLSVAKQGTTEIDCLDNKHVYDTIQSRVCSNDTSTAKKINSKRHDRKNMSLNETGLSNCYESISLKNSSYSTINQILRHAISSQTLSSEHRINSIYGQSLTPTSDRSASDNSDEWVDLSDEDNNVIGEDHFIVICKKNKIHKSPDWSRLVHQKIHGWDDDSDHHYESLYSIQQQRAKLEEESASRKSHNSEVYDSFDSDDEESTNNDVANKKLPEIPYDSQQASKIIYQRPSITDHMLQKIKNFGSISKNEISKGISKIAKKRSSLGNLPSSRSKFYENTETEGDSCYSTTIESKTLNKKARGLSKLQRLGRLTMNKLPTNFSLNESFENSMYQDGNRISSPNLSQSMNEVTSPGNQAVEANKSLKTKFRKSFTPLIGSSSTSNIYGALGSKSSTFYVTESVDVDSGIFAVNDKVISSPNNSNLSLNSSSVNNVNCENKRRSISVGISSRPNDPPPPPPPEKNSADTPQPATEASPFSSERSNESSASWFTECELFKNIDLNDQNVDAGNKKSMSSWYTESGLYQTSNSSLASSSGSSGVSTGGENSPKNTGTAHSLFLNEPLYQLYTAAKLESISSSEFDPEAESDGYEEITKKDIAESITDEPARPRPTALQLIEPNQGPSRTLWSEVPEVLNSGIFSQLSQNEKRLQEAKFEILTSEASYLRSLKLLRSQFMNHPAFRDPQNLDPADRKTLFSYVIPVLECSDRLLRDLESCWQESILLKNLSKPLYKHAEKHFQVYISYCEHQGRLDRTLKRLKETKPAFKENLDLLENDPVCCGLNLHSFLMLPMQRITRLPLLIDAVMTKLKLNDEEFDSWKMTLAILNKVVSQCNQAANRCEEAFEMEVLSKQIEFPANITPFPLIPFNVGSKNRITRSLVRRGELVHIIYRGDDAKLTFGKKSAVKKNIYCFLFTDIIILTKKKSDESFLVFDYCQRSLLHLSSGDTTPQLPHKDLSQSGKYIIFMSLLENCTGKPIDLILSCPSETERQRWLATAPRASENPLEILYEQWDCPQVRVNHAYGGHEPDELDLMVGDFVNVLRKMKDDGWYFGERIRDGAQGWFPGNYAEEVHSSHVRARNLKQRHRLLLYTANFLDSIKEPKKK